MKLKKIMRALLLVSILAGTALLAFSCKGEDPGGSGITQKSSISGIVKDTQGNPLPDVAVTLKGTDTKRMVEATTTSGPDGSFSFSDVLATNQFLTFEKKGYSLVGITVPSSNLLAGAVTLSPILEYANAVIKGRILDAQNGNAPLAGVNVSIGSRNITTGADGTFLFDHLTIQEYTLSCTKAGSASVVKSLTVDMFGKEGIIVVDDISMGGKILLPDLTAQDLKDAQLWYANEYRGGYGRGGGRIDWSTSFMSCQFFNWVGNCEVQNEGCTLRINNDDNDRTNPADLVNFDTFTYGRKRISADNKIMSVYARCHQATNENPVFWGVQVIDLSAADPTVDLIGGVRQHPSGDYKTFEFDLSPYIGKEVIVAIGHFRAKTGDYWNQFCIAHVSFAPKVNEGDDYLPGTPVKGLEDWHMTEEMVRSTMPNPRTHFIGYSLPEIAPFIFAKRHPGYYFWGKTGHIASEWSFQYVNKDAEPLPSEGFIMKTRSNVKADYHLPESYFYSKFAISGGHNKLLLKARSFDSSVPTTFKFTVIRENGKVTFLDPVKNTAVSAGKVEEGGNGCWQFINEKGGQGNPADYATFEYDLSAFDGEAVMVCISVHKGEVPGQGGEQKLCLYSIDIQ